MLTKYYIRTIYCRRLALSGPISAVLTIIICGTTAAVAFSQSPQPSPSPVTHGEIKRWFDFEALSLATRYRYIRNRNGTVAANQLQYQFAALGVFKFDRKSRFSVHAGLFAGNSFAGGWNTTGWGTGDLQTTLFLKQLYFDAKPVKAIEVQYGGIAVNNGENTEITGYDNDAYLTGERLQIRDPKKLYFDEVSITYAYLGDLNTPSVFRRFKHLDKSNYHQLLVRKQVNKRIGFSADYSFESGIDTLRQAVKFKLPESKIADSFVFENYERVDESRGYGFALSGEKKLGKKLTLTGGFAKISNRMLNGDRYPQGKRLYLNGAYKATHELTISSIIIQGVGPLATPQTPRSRFEVIANFNLLEALHRSKLF